VRQDLRDYTRAIAFLTEKLGNIEVLRAVAPYVIWHRVNLNRSSLDRPPYYGTRRLDYIRDLVERSINRTLNERSEMNMIFSHAIDGEISITDAINELSSYDDPIARLDYIPCLERMR
ncbi:MAG: ATPase, partial [Methanotrichaceae archaeon]